jgi:hypothetical protein
VADWGDTGFYPPAVHPWWDAGFGSVTLAQSSVNVLGVNTIRFGANYFTLGRSPLNLVIAIPGVTPNAAITLTKNGQMVDVTASAGSTAYFYDFQNGTYIANDTVSGASWKVVIVGPSVTVTQFNAPSGRPVLGQVFPLGMYFGNQPMTLPTFVENAYISAGTYTLAVPLNVTQVRLRMAGAGAGAGASATGAFGGGGGGSGAYGEGWFGVTGGTTLTIQVGAGGVGGIAGGAAAANGGSTSVSGLTGGTVSVGGGFAGSAATGSANGSSGAGAGAPSGFTLALTGSYGATGYAQGSNGIGGAGGPAYNAGGALSGGGANGAAATLPGAGATGGGFGNQNGGKGQDAAVMVEWAQ